MSQRVKINARTGDVIIRYPRYVRYLRDDFTLPWWFPALRGWWAVQRLFRGW